jgi:polyhydroxybutyrate depolymerase
VSGLRDAREERTVRYLGVVLTLLAVAAAAGCGANDNDDDETSAGPGLHEFTLDYRGEPYLLFVPSSHDPDTPMPLVVVLHGSPSSAREIYRASRLDQLAEREGFLVAYPEDQGRADIMRELVSHLVDTWHAEPGEVYVTGFSAGASAAWRLAAEAADVFAAAAPMSGPLQDTGNAIAPAAPVSVIAFIGLEDGRFLERMEAGVAHWQQQLDCTPGDPTWVDGGEEQVSRTVAGCQDGSEVVAYRIAGMGHVWAGQTPGFAPNQTMWDFLVAHRR